MQSQPRGRCGLARVVLSGFALAACLTSSAAQANGPPVVSNVTAAQLPGTGQVEIRYLLAEPEGASCTVWLEISEDDGATWSYPGINLSGDVGPGVQPGSGKRIVWHAGADLPDRFGNFRFRVSASDSQAPPGMVLIPGGSFEMGDTFAEGSSVELPVHTVALSAFSMDRYEVTNAQYAAALNWALARGDQITVTSGVVYKYNSGTSYPYCDTTTSSSYSRITWNGSTFGVVAGKEDHPMVRVSWYGAVAYANWRSGLEGKPLCYDLSTWTCNFAAAGYRLPTEAEWEKAARGGTPGHRFPWSDTDTIQHARANYYSTSSYAYDTSPTQGFHPTFAVGGYPYTSPVGYFAPNGYGLYDMAGNVWEWCNDWWSDSYYASSPGSNPAGPLSGTGRVLRGGSWDISAYYCRCAFRDFGSYPGHRYYGLGFRLALDSE